MSRIRGIEAKLENDILSHKKRRNEIAQRKNENQLSKSLSKDEVERQQIAELLVKLPKLEKTFEVHRKIGEGTFSSVYLGSLKKHNDVADDQKRWFAIKHLVPTAHPARVEHELKCLQDMGGKNFVIGVELCLRHLDTIVFIMPYIPHKKFSEYVADMDSEELRQYMRALLTALKHVHSFGVIHRDIKPSNFLYDRENRRYLLVDFGLAQRVCASANAEESAPTPTPPPPAHASSAPKKRPREQGESPPDSKRMALDLSVGHRAAIAEGNESHPPPVSAQPLPPSVVSLCRSKLEGHALHTVVKVGSECGRGAACVCAGARGVCAACVARPAARAPRAGTQGFRPPEVLLKYPHQTTAVDSWACGVVLLSVLCARYPLFRAADDVSALAELGSLLGTGALRRLAAALQRRLIASSARPPLCLRKLCARLRSPQPSAAAAAYSPHPACRRCRLPAVECLCRDETKSARSFSADVSVCGFPDSAFSLAAGLLEPHPDDRLTARDALKHPFLDDS